MSTVLRGGRLPTPTRKDVVDFTSSLEGDRHIAESTVLVNEAHVIALQKAGVLSKNEALQLLGTLRRIERNTGFQEKVEDIHLLIEEHVTKQVGSMLGGKLHTGKSRNDQVAAAIRITLRGSLLDLSASVVSLSQSLLELAKKHVRTFFVGYTHFQPAQPITFAHYLIGILDPLLRDNERILEAYPRVNCSPMGAGALAGSSFPINRQLVAHLLGFAGTIENSLDAVGSRDFALETLAVCAIIASDISRLAQDLIFYSSVDVDLIDLPEEFSSTSSIMPHKKNPDLLELIRARCSRVSSNFGSASALIHALPSGYSLDFQELTPLLWDSIQTLHSCLKLLTMLVPRLRPSKQIDKRDGVRFTVAAEVANTIVRETKTSFRDAYRAVGNAVRTAQEEYRSLADFSENEWNTLLQKQIGGSAYVKIVRTAVPRGHFDVYKTRGSPKPEEAGRMIKVRAARIRSAIQQARTLSASSERSIRNLRVRSRTL